VATAVERSEILQCVATHVKLVIVGASGVGKSNLLREVLLTAAAGGEHIPVYLDLKQNPRPPWASQLVANPDRTTVVPSMDALLMWSGLAIAPTVEDLKAFSAVKTVLLIIDALNEVDADVGVAIRDTVDQYVRFHGPVFVLASDRREGLYSDWPGWTVLKLACVMEDEARAVVDAKFGTGQYDGRNEEERKLLRIPFFLNWALQEGKLELGSRASAVNGYLQSANINEEDFEPAARFAFSLYEPDGVVTDLGGTVQPKMDNPVMEKLRQAEIVVDGSSGPIFSHQLIHQFLAGYYLGRNHESWSAKTLDRVTSYSASNDTVGMTIAAIQDLAERDRFLRIVYDWNWRAAVLALVETQTPPRRVSPALETAVLAMAAERLFDPVEYTRDRVAGLLHLVPGEIAERMRAARNHEDVVSEVLQADYDDVGWWVQWREFFSWDPDTHTLQEAEVAAIGSTEPLIGWTVANGIRRFTADNDVSRDLRAIYRSQLRDEPAANVIRWRVVHALGMWPTQSNADFLLEAVTDPDPWVTYGAVRSVVEIAVITTDRALRISIIESLGTCWRHLRPESLSRLAVTSIYGGADSDWAPAIRPLLDEVRIHQSGVERLRWDRYLDRFDEFASLDAGT
jgi:hypothetical protein